MPEPNVDHATATRKVQMVGGATLAITLPKPWLDVVGVGAGDEVTLQLRADGAVVITPRRERGIASRERTVQVATQDAEELLRILTAVYLAGTDIIHLKKSAPFTAALRRGIEGACSRLPGLQIVDETATSVTLQDLADPVEFNMVRGVRMMQLNADRMLHIVRKRLAGEDDPLLVADLEHSEAELDRLLLLITKQHNRLLRDLTFGEKTGVSPQDGLNHLLLAIYLERIGDYTCRIARREETPPSGERTAGTDRALGVLDLATKSVQDAVVAFHRRNAALANDAVRLAVNVSRLAQEALQEMGITEREPGAMLAFGAYLDAASLFEDIERIALYAKSIAEIAINHAFLESEKTETV